MPKIEINFKTYFPTSATFYEYFIIIQRIDTPQNNESQPELITAPLNTRAIIEHYTV